MAILDDEPARKSRTHEIGQDLSTLSINELRSHIDILRDEITRIEAELQSKDTTRSTAEALFRQS